MFTVLPLFAPHIYIIFHSPTRIENQNHMLCLVCLQNELVLFHSGSNKALYGQLLKLLYLEP